MISWPIPAAQLAEVRQLIVELAVSAEGGDLLELKHDATLPIAGTGRRRQVELFVRYAVGEVEHSRVVETQKRGRKVDDQFLDAVERRLQQLGIDGAIILCDAGFTHDVLKRIERSRLLTAVQYWKPNVALWPIDPAGVLATITRIDSPPVPIVLEPAVSMTRLGTNDNLLVLLGREPAAGCVVAAVMPRKADERGEHHISLWVLEDDEPFRAGEATIHVTMPDGSRRLVIGPTGDPLLVPPAIEQG